MSETIQRTKLYEDVTERMLDHIRTETWAPGTKIPPEVELAKLFDVSRCTIREAVKSLQIAGFLRSRASCRSCTGPTAKRRRRRSLIHI